MRKSVPTLTKLSLAGCPIVKLIIFADIHSKKCWLGGKNKRADKFYNVDTASEVYTQCRENHIHNNAQSVYYMNNSDVLVGCDERYIRNCKVIFHKGAYAEYDNHRNNIRQIKYALIDMGVHKAQNYYVCNKNDGNFVIEAFGGTDNARNLCHITVGKRFVERCTHHSANACFQKAYV